MELLDGLSSGRGPAKSCARPMSGPARTDCWKMSRGLVYRPDSPPGRPEYLVNTGVQRLVQDLDELPLPLEAMGLFEPPHGHATLCPQPVPAERIGRYAKILAMVTTHGCQFHCSYCPIPGYNQFKPSATAVRNEWSSRSPGLLNSADHQDLCHRR